MSINVTPPRVGPLGYPALRRPADVAQERATGSAQRIAEQPPHTDALGALDRSNAATTAGVPNGVDPDLWTVLTAEERSFFAKVSDMGPLTYGPRPGKQVLPSARLGSRLDVKV